MDNYQKTMLALQKAHNERMKKEEAERAALTKRQKEIVEKMIKRTDQVICSFPHCIQRSMCYHKKLHTMKQCKAHIIDQGDRQTCGGDCTSTSKLKSVLIERAKQKIKEARWEAKYYLKIS